MILRVCQYLLIEHKEAFKLNEFEGFLFIREPCGTKLEPLFSGFKAVVRTLNKKYTQNTTIQYADFQYLRYDTIAYQFAVRSLIIPYTFESGTHK